MENCVYGYVFRVILSGNDVQNGDEVYYVSVRKDNSLIHSLGSGFLYVRILYVFG